VRVNVGDRVKKGDVLATFAADTVRAEAAQARASLMEAEASAAEAAANAERARSLQASGALSARRSASTSPPSRPPGHAWKPRAPWQPGAATAAEPGQVLAPDDGVISARTATVGAVVGAGTELFRLIRKAAWNGAPKSPPPNWAASRPARRCKSLPPVAPTGRQACA
jgi:HlyD family secretion protein